MAGAIANCPKCESEAVPCGPEHDDYVDARWKCGSHVHQPDGLVPQKFQQTATCQYRCRIRDLESQLARLQAPAATGEIDIAGMQAALERGEDCMDICDQCGRLRNDLFRNGHNIANFNCIHRITPMKIGKLLSHVTRLEAALTGERAAEMERCAKILETRADQQDEKHRKANGWYVDDGESLRQIAYEIRSGSDV